MRRFALLFTIFLFLSLTNSPESMAGEEELPEPTLFLPHVLSTLKPVPAWRMGVGTTLGSLSRFPQAAELNAGWSMNWTVDPAPTKPDGSEFIQTVRLHQRLTCPLSTPYAWDRTRCLPIDDWILITPKHQIAAAAAAQPGSLWLIGNEMDRRDWPACEDPPACLQTSTAHQDEMLAQTYARAYHFLYFFIKRFDPTARIAIGGVIQATPLRLAYLSAIWDSYSEQFGEEMPVDVWNVHAFMLREERAGAGADVPPGTDAIYGEYIHSDCTHMDRELFDRQIRAMRTWMAERGQRHKPLIVSEYGVLYPQSYTGPCPRALDPTVEQSVHDFMTWTWDYFRTTRDESIGMPADDHLLVQRWAWFSLDHVLTDGNGVEHWGINPFASLLDAGTGELRSAGHLFSDYARVHTLDLRRKVLKD